MIGKWQGDWQGQWQGATGAPGSMSAAGFISITATATLTAAAVEEEQVGGRRFGYHYFEEQRRIAERIRRQNEAIVAMALMVALAEEEE